jgi:hypothetical protein
MRVEGRGFDGVTRINSGRLALSGQPVKMHAIPPILDCRAISTRLVFKSNTGEFPTYNKNTKQLDEMDLVEERFTLGRVPRHRHLFQLSDY